MSKDTVIIEGEEWDLFPVKRITELRDAMAEIHEIAKWTGHHHDVLIDNVEDIERRSATALKLVEDYIHE